MFRLYNVFFGFNELLLKANPVACLTRQSAFSATQKLKIFDCVTHVNMFEIVKVKIIQCAFKIKKKTY